MGIIREAIGDEEKPTKILTGRKLGKLLSDIFGTRKERKKFKENNPKAFSETYYKHKYTGAYYDKNNNVHLINVMSDRDTKKTRRYGKVRKIIHVSEHYPDGYNQPTSIRWGKYRFLTDK